MSKFNISKFKKASVCSSNNSEYEPINEFGVKLRKGFILKEHQIEAIKWMKTREQNEICGILGGINCSEMGLGKTSETLVTIMSEYSNDIAPEYPTLVVCPLSALYTWEREIDKFFGSTCKYKLIKPDIMSKKELEELDSNEIKKYHIILTNYDTIRTVAKKYKVYQNMFESDNFGRTIGIKNVTPITEQIEETGLKLLFSIPWNRAVFDESHHYNNPKSAIFYSVMSIHANKKWGLTGTPIRNETTDLYAQLRVIGFNKIVDKKMFTFELYKQCELAKVILYMTREDAGIELPEINNVNVLLKLQGKEKEMYDHLYKMLKSMHISYITEKLSFTNILSLFIRLRQYCTAPFTILSNIKSTEDDEIYNENEKVIDMSRGIMEWLSDKEGTAGIKFIKITAALNIITKKIPKQDKVLVYTSFKRFIELFEFALSKDEYKNIKYQIVDGDITGEERKETLKKFQTDLDQKLLFMTYKVGSESLNLIEANHIILLEPVWCPAVIDQTICRVHRLGQNKPVTIWTMSIEGTIEQKMLELCDKKRQISQDFVNNKKEDYKITAQVIGDILSN